MLLYDFLAFITSEVDDFIDAAGMVEFGLLRRDQNSFVDFTEMG